MLRAACEKNADVRRGSILVITQAREYLLGPTIFDALALVNRVKNDESAGRVLRFGMPRIQRSGNESLELIQTISWSESGDPMPRTTFIRFKSLLRARSRSARVGH